MLSIVKRAARRGINAFAEATNAALASNGRLIEATREYLAGPVMESIQRAPHGTDASTQIQLMMTYRLLPPPLPRFSEVGFKCHSQTDEDGILLFLFAILGVTNKFCVEICAGDGLESNTANLIINHGWHALLVDGDDANVERGKKFYARSPHTYVDPPTFERAWITRRNVNTLITGAGFTGEIDLLSIDVDGVDYWIWKAIDSISPRVVVVEYQDILGPERAWTVPYSDNFTSADYPMTDGMPNFGGASLSAFVKLGREKGYRLVGVNRYCYNAFFVRNGIGDDLVPEIDAAACFDHPKVRRGMRERFPLVKDLPWVEV